MKRRGREENPALAKWCECAVTYIPAREDRREVYRELYGHMEDKLEDLMGSGVGKKDAEEMTVRAMGDYDETGRELAALYRPLRRRALAAARAAFVVTAVMAAVMALGLVGRITNAVSGQDGPRWVEAAKEDVVAPDCVDETDGYIITVPRAMRAEGGVFFTVNFKKPWPWMKEPRVGAFYAVDSEGERYEIPGFDRELTEKYLTLERGTNRYSGLFTCSFEGWIRGFDGEWFELRYDRDGRDVRLRVEPGGEGR